jgi:hypothetical protein
MEFLGKFFKLGGEAIVLYLARLLDIKMNINAIPGDWKQASDSHLKRRSLIGSSKLWTVQPNLSGLQTNGARYSRVPETSLGNEWVVI